MLDLTVQLENQFEEKLTPGIHEVEISGLIEKEENSKSYIEIGIIGANGIHNERLYVTDNAKDYTMYKLQQISLACGYTMEQIGLIKSVKQLAKALVGKRIAIKLSGVEKEYTKDGVTKRFIQAFIGLGKFCMPIEAKDKLVFVENDKGAKGDIKYLPEKKVEEKTFSSEAVSDEDSDALPF